MKLLIGLVFLCVIGIIKLQESKSFSININFNSKISNYLKGQSLDSRSYKKILEETIPYVEDYSNVGHTSDNFFSKSFLLLTGISWDNLNTVIEIIVPTAKYFNINSQEYAQNIMEIGGAFEEYKNSHQIIQDEEDYYDLEDENTDIFEDPFNNTGIKYTKEQLADMNFLQRNIYNFEGNLILSQKDLPVLNLMNKDLSIKKKSNKPQILIFHTHTKAFLDSSPEI